jgi:acetoacetate decarboxylase
MGYGVTGLVPARIESSASIIDKMSKTQVNLKLVPEVDGSLAIAQLVGYNLTDIQVNRVWRARRVSA